eukprot:TRINITY_DN30249_c0_g2_i1.p1 TRINITY_DN30249_c0_g2~~TRINITY_DN30249_c0_g2_i1.p1  ORF type:complete len:416 (+),score=107.80 TRINITY_DN30249_c0_g2_i1:47-1249(+)
MNPLLLQLRSAARRAVGSAPASLGRPHTGICNAGGPARRVAPLAPRTLQRRWCTAGTGEAGVEPEAGVPNAADDYDEEDWVVLGHLDRPIPFTPTDPEDEDLLRGETEMYHLYRGIEAGEVDWMEFVDLFTVCDQELVATAFMWSMYLKILPTLFGVKREFSRLLDFSHDYDTQTLNIVVQQLYRHGSNSEALRMWEMNIIQSNKRISNPNVMSLKIACEQVVPIDTSDDEWWLDRGILFAQSQRFKATRYRHFVDHLTPIRITPSMQVHVVDMCFAAMARHEIQPDLTLLYLMARACPVDIDYGRLLATRLAMMMETVDDSVVPLEARLLVTDFLHYKLESIEINPELSVMQGRQISTGDKIIVFIDDLKQAMLSPFRPDTHRPPSAHATGPNTIRIDV